MITIDFKLLINEQDYLFGIDTQIYSKSIYTLNLTINYHSQQYLVEIKKHWFDQSKNQGRCELLSTKCFVFFFFFAAAVQDSDQSASDNQERDRGTSGGNSCRVKFLFNRMSTVFDCLY